MKRRVFLAAAGTVGAVGAVSAGSLVSSAYSSLTVNACLQEFSTPTRTAWNKFSTDISKNVKSLGLDDKYVSMITSPVQVISKSQENIVFKNKSGQVVSLSIVDGMERIEFLEKAA